MVINNRNIKRRRQQLQRQSPSEPSPENSDTPVYSDTPINPNSVSPRNIPVNIPSNSSAFRRISTPTSIRISPGNTPNSFRISPANIPDNSDRPPLPLILRPPPLILRPPPLRLRDSEILPLSQSDPTPLPTPPLTK